MQSPGDEEKNDAKGNKLNPVKHGLLPKQDIHRCLNRPVALCKIASCHLRPKGFLNAARLGDFGSALFVGWVFHGVSRGAPKGVLVLGRVSLGEIAEVVTNFK